MAGKVGTRLGAGGELWALEGPGKPQQPRPGEKWARLVGRACRGAPWTWNRLMWAVLAGGHVSGRASQAQRWQE